MAALPQDVRHRKGAVKPVWKGIQLGTAHLECIVLKCVGFNNAYYNSIKLWKPMTAADDAEILQPGVHRTEGVNVARLSAEERELVVRAPSDSFEVSSISASRQLRRLEFKHSQACKGRVLPKMCSL